MVSSHPEYTGTFEIPDGWVVPDLSGFIPAGGRINADSTTLLNSYYDTAHARHYLHGRATWLFYSMLESGCSWQYGSHAV